MGNVVAAADGSWQRDVDKTSPEDRQNDGGRSRIVHPTGCNLAPAGHRARHGS